MSHYEQSFKHLWQAQEGAEHFKLQHEKISDYASKVLRENGGLVIADSGTFGGTKGRYGSSEQGIRFTQATIPAMINVGKIVALRDSKEDDRNTIELLALDSQDPSKLASKTELDLNRNNILRLAVFGEDNVVSLPNLPELRNDDSGYGYLKDVSYMIDAINAKTTPHGLRVPNFPVNDLYGRYNITDGVHAIHDIRFSPHLMPKG